MAEPHRFSGLVKKPADGDRDEQRHQRREMVAVDERARREMARWIPEDMVVARKVFRQTVGGFQKGEDNQGQERAAPAAAARSQIEARPERQERDQALDEGLPGGIRIDRQSEPARRRLPQAGPDMRGDLQGMG